MNCGTEFAEQIVIKSTAGLEIEGLHYERLSIKKLRLERLGVEEEDDDEGKGHRMISRLLGRILGDIDHEEENE